jgi:hypothetical protein
VDVKEDLLDKWDSPILEYDIGVVFKRHGVVFIASLKGLSNSMISNQIGLSYDQITFPTPPF